MADDQPLASGRTLADRLAAAGVSDEAEPWDAWLQLRAAEGDRTTVIDLYELVAAAQGLAAHELPAATRLSLAQQATAQKWPGFAVTEGTERPRVPLVVVEYDPAWPQTYKCWRRQVAAALGRTALRIEHVGSTSVPGLAAKPIVDIQVSVADLGDEPRYVPALQATGLALRSRDELHRYFPAASGRATRGTRPCLRRRRPVGARPPAVPRLSASSPGGMPPVRRSQAGQRPALERRRLGLHRG